MVRLFWLGLAAASVASVAWAAGPITPKGEDLVPLEGPFNWKYAYPAPAAAAGASGGAAFTCKADSSGHFVNCAVEVETPAGQGFGESLIKYWTSRRQLTPAAVQAYGADAVYRWEIFLSRNTLQQNDAVFLQLSPADAARAARAKVPAVKDIAEKATQTDWKAAYPPAAAAAGVTGEAALFCGVGADQHLKDCRVQAESTPGFGEAMMPLAVKTRLKPAAVKALGADPVVRFSGAFSDAFLFDTPPDWLKRPTPEQMNAAFPLAAMNAGVTGMGVVSCKVNLAGMLEQCFVLGEKPIGLGFGGAALLLTPAFLMKPATRDGHPVVSSVNIPVTFAVPPNDPQTGSLIRKMEPGVRVLNQAPFDRTPTYADIVAAWPGGSDSSGKTALQCRLHETGSVDACAITFESNPRFERASRDLAKKFHVAMGAEVSKTDIANIQVAIPLQFVSPAAAQPARPITHAVWTALPAPADADKLYPAAAKGQGVKSGSATVECTVGPAGRLDTCKVLNESTPNLGFGEAALRMSSMMQMALWGDDGLPTPGATVRVPLKFEQPAEAVAAK